MGKKNKEKSTFSKVLKENRKKIDIIVSPSDGSTKTLAEITDESIEAITGTPIESLVPVTVTEAAESSVNDLQYTAIRTTYTDALYSLYEMGIKTGQKQTLIIPLTSDAAEDLEQDDRFADILDALRKTTNLEMIWDDMPRKVFKRAAAWSVDDSGDPMFVIRIPNVCMFYSSIQKNVANSPLLFDLIVAITNVSTKSLRKAKKAGSDRFSEFQESFTTNLVKIMANFGASSVHVPLWMEFFADEEEAAVSWVNALKAGKPATLKRFSFATPDAITLLSFNRNLIENINSKECGMKVV